MQKETHHQHVCCNVCASFCAACSQGGTSDCLPCYHGGDSAATVTAACSFASSSHGGSSGGCAIHCGASLLVLGPADVAINKAESPPWEHGKQSDMPPWEQAMQKEAHHQQMYVAMSAPLSVMPAPRVAPPTVFLATMVATLPRPPQQPDHLHHQAIVVAQVAVPSIVELHCWYSDQLMWQPLC